MITLYAVTEFNKENGHLEDNAFILGQSLLGDGKVFAEENKKRFVIDRLNRKSIQFEIQGRSDIQAPSWGIVSNSGSVSFVDSDGSIGVYANNGQLVSGMPFQIFCKNTLTKKEERIAYMLTDTWSYNNLNRNVSVNIKDDLEKWQDIEFEGFSLSHPTTLYDIYETLKEFTEKFGFSFSPLKEEVEKIIKYIHIKYPNLKSGNLWSQWNKICECASLYILKNKDNQVELNYYNGG